MLVRRERKELSVIGDSGWIELVQVQTAAGSRSMVQRKNGKFTAVKALPLVVSPDVEIPRMWKDASLKDWIRKIGIDNLSVYFLAADRPITYLAGEEVGLRENFVFELPGGIVEPGEKPLDAARREFSEEADTFGKVQTLCVEPLTNDFGAWDAGTHVEWYQIFCVIVQGEMSPPKAKNGKLREGIIPEECQLVPLRQARAWIDCVRWDRGIATEGYAIHALDALCATLHGGWGSLV